MLGARPARSRRTERMSTTVTLATMVTTSLEQNVWRTRARPALELPAPAAFPSRSCVQLTTTVQLATQATLQLGQGGCLRAAKHSTAAQVKKRPVRRANVKRTGAMRITVILVTQAITDLELDASHMIASQGQTMAA